jgi:YHS domain-containing protein
MDGRTIKRRLLTVACLMLIAMLPLPPRAEEPRSPRLQKHCPLTNDPLNRQFYVDHDGKRIYGCGPHCVELIKENPKKFIRQLEAEGVTLEPVPK